MSISFEQLFTIEYDIERQIVGDVPMGYFRRTGIIRGGTFTGPVLKGRALPGGGDFLFIRKDGVIHLDVRAVLETDKGQTFYMTYTGRLKSPPDAEERLARGETIGPNELYFRTAVQFETAAPDLAWMNDIIAFGMGFRKPNGPVYDIYALK